MRRRTAGAVLLACTPLVDLVVLGAAVLDARGSYPDQVVASTRGAGVLVAAPLRPRPAGAGLALGVPGTAAHPPHPNPGEARPDRRGHRSTGGTRIGGGVKDFNERFGTPEMTRGAVVLVGQPADGRRAATAHSSAGWMPRSRTATPSSAPPTSTPSTNCSPPCGPDRTKQHPGDSRQDARVAVVVDSWADAREVGI